MMTAALAKGDMQDRVRDILLSYHTREVKITVDDLVGRTGFDHSQVYQTLYRLQQANELTIIKDDDGQRPRIIGVRLNKITEPSEVHHRVVSREITDKTTKKFPATLAYIKRRLAVERAKEEVLKANLRPDDVISFTPDPLGEEAILLFHELIESTSRNKIIEQDLIAERRNAEFYKNSRDADGQRLQDSTNGHNSL